MKHRVLFSLIACWVLVFVNSPSWGQNTDSSEYQNSSYDEEYYNEYEDEDYETNSYDEPKDYGYQPDIKQASSPSVAQQRKIEEQKWQKLTNDPQFNYTSEKPKSPPDLSWWYKFVEKVMLFFMSGFGKTILILLAAIAVILIVIKIVQLNGNILFAKRDKKLNNNLDELADDYVPDNWEQSIQDAAKVGNYRLAVRHLYRYLLHTMQEKSIINYQISKTNYQYIYELSGTNYQKAFTALTRDYEYAWYGGFDIAQNHFEQYQNQINHFKNNL